MSYQELKAFLLAEEYGIRYFEGIANKCPVSLKPNFIDFPDVILTSVSGY
jgi:hypothetical protein